MSIGKLLLSTAGVLGVGWLVIGVGAGSAAGTNGTIMRPSVIIPQVRANEQNLQLAQSGDAAFRINQLEDQLRQLNGQLEDLNFQLLQMQEQMRRMQEDYEFRFQELENKQQGALDNSDTQVASKRIKKDFRVEKPAPSDLSANSNKSDGETLSTKSRKEPRMIDGVEIYDGTNDQEENDGREVPLGTITFDSLGNVVDTALGKPVDLTASLRGSMNQESGNDKNHAQLDLDAIGSAKELFELGYEFVQSGDYHNSQLVFAAFVERYPDDPKIANAQFWLGESMFSLKNFDGAAKVFLDTHTNWPDARIAPQALLKLGISLVGMQQRELACATYVKVYKKYPDISAALRKRVKSEQKSARCING